MNTDIPHYNTFSYNDFISTYWKTFQIKCLRHQTKTMNKEGPIRQPIPTKNIVFLFSFADGKDWASKTDNITTYWLIYNKQDWKIAATSEPDVFWECEYIL